MQSSRTISANGIEIFLLEQGQGPLVLLCHGWPELSYSWRHQIPALAAAGFRVAAPDMRGFGRTSAPAEIDAYSIFDHVGDMVALVAALGEKQAVIVGHDWGAPVAWHAAMFRPDVFTAVAGLSVPRLFGGVAGRSKACAISASAISIGNIFRPQASQNANWSAMSM
jgi:pimeloyl-ACP methyl ester carboxylesterase